jgi:hypothetical protein
MKPEKILTGFLALADDLVYHDHPKEVYFEGLFIALVGRLSHFCSILSLSFLVLEK